MKLYLSVAPTQRNLFILVITNAMLLYVVTETFEVQYAWKVHVQCTLLVIAKSFECIALAFDISGW